MLSVNKNNMKLRHYEDFEIFYILIVMSSQFMQFIVSNYATMSKSAILKVERQLPNNAGYPQNIVRCLTKNIGSTDNINECSTLQHNPVSKISNYCQTLDCAQFAEYSRSSNQLSNNFYARPFAFETSFVSKNQMFRGQMMQMP